MALTGRKKPRLVSLFPLSRMVLVGTLMVKPPICRLLVMTPVKVFVPGKMLFAAVETTLLWCSVAAVSGGTVMFVPLLLIIADATTFDWDAFSAFVLPLPPPNVFAVPMFVGNITFPLNGSDKFVVFQ